MDDLKQIVNIIRNLRGSMNLSLSLKVPLLISGSDIEQEFFKYLIFLCKLESIKLIDNISTSNQSFAIFRSTKLILDVSIDKDKQLLRVNKEKDKLLKSILKLEDKLSNSNYIEKAPINLVERDRKELLRLQGQLKEIDDQINKLK